MPASSIAEKIVVITEAGNGIGATTARLLAENGAKVILGASRWDILDALVRQIRDAGGRASGYKTDQARRDPFDELIQGAMDEHDRIDVIINCSGIEPKAPMASPEAEAWEKMIDANISVLLNGIAAVLPIMQRQKHGHIINVATLLEHQSLAPRPVVYGAATLAVRAITESLRIVLKADHIRSTMISPFVRMAELPERGLQFATRQHPSRQYQMAVPVPSIAQAIARAIEQPPSA